MSGERFTLRAAVYLILIKEGKTLLCRRFNTGWMDGKYSLIAGHLDGKESVSKAMIREAFEEAGIKVSEEDLIPIRVLHRLSSDSEYMDFFFLAEKWEGEPRQSRNNIITPDLKSDKLSSNSPTSNFQIQKSRKQ